MKKRGKDNHKIVLAFIIFLLAFSFFIAINPTTYTSFVTLQHTNPELSISLDKESYDKNEIITGNITINFKGPINIYTNLSVKFNGFEYKQDIRDVLFQLGKTFSSTNDEVKAINPSDSKILIYDKADKKLLGFRLPFEVSVSSVDMNIFSEIFDNSYPSSLALDIRDDNDLEWRYLGEFSSFKDEYVQSDTLDLNVVPASTILDNNITYHCSLLNIPFSRDFEVSANYRLLNETSVGGDIKAAILSYDAFTNQATGGADNCDLPEPGMTFSWNSCNIKISTAIEGPFLVCLYNERPFGAYRIASDFSTSQNTFQCILDSSCDQKQYLDYFIRVRGANYNAVFTTPIKLSQTNVSIDQLKIAIEQEIANCKILDNNFCVIPIAISSASKGKVLLTNLIVNIGGVEYNLFYDLITIPGVIYEINKRPLENLSLSLSIKSFNLTLDDKSKVLEVALEPGAVTREEIKLFEVNTTDLEKDILNIEEELNGLKNNTFLQFFDYDIDKSLSQLQQYKNELNLLTNLSSYEIENKTKEIKNKLELFKSNLPKTIGEREIIRDNVIIEPNDLIDVVGVNERASVYELQNRVNIDVEAITIESNLYSGTKVKKTLVKKTIIPKENLDNIYVYEKVPKNIANNIDNIKLLDDFEVVEKDPLVRKRFNKLFKNNAIEFSYVLDGEFINNVFDIKTFIVPLDLEIKAEPKEEEKYRCGDNTCSIPFEDEISCPVDCKAKINPWPYIIIGIIVILIGVIYFNFYRGRFDFRRLTRGRNPFKTKEDLENVKKFIKNSLNRNIDKKNITKALLHKGWNKKQIKYAFEELEWEQKWVLIKIEAPETDKNVKVLKKYIRRCRRAKMDDNRIKNILSNKGWTENQINEGFKEAKGWF